MCVISMNRWPYEVGNGAILTNILPEERNTYKPLEVKEYLAKNQNKHR